MSAVSVALGVALGEDRRDHFADGTDALGQRVQSWWIEGNSCGPDLRLGASEAARHRLLGHQKGACDLWRRESCDDPQGQRDLCLWAKGRVATSDQERELVIESLRTVEVDVGRPRAVGGGRCTVTGQRRQTIFESLHSADLIDGFASAGRDQPGTRSLGDPIGGPPRRRLDKRVLCGIFRDAEVADVTHERGHQPWPLRTKDVGDTHQIRQQPVETRLVSLRIP